MREQCHVTRGGLDRLGTDKTVCACAFHFDDFDHPNFGFVAREVSAPQLGPPLFQAKGLSGRLLADIVAKVENRTSLKISQKPMFRRLGRCNAR
jgi:hypothetical protein